MSAPLDPWDYWLITMAGLENVIGLARGEARLLMTEEIAGSSGGWSAGRLVREREVNGPAMCSAERRSTARDLSGGVTLRAYSLASMARGKRTRKVLMPSEASLSLSF